jgi:small basic protein
MGFSSDTGEHQAGIVSECFCLCDLLEREVEKEMMVSKWLLACMLGIVLVYLGASLPENELFFKTVCLLFGSFILGFTASVAERRERENKVEKK